MGLSNEKKLSIPVNFNMMLIILKLKTYLKVMAGWMFSLVEVTGITVSNQVDDHSGLR